MVKIEYFYSAHSAFAYLGSKRFMEIAEASGRAIDHRPVDLRKVIAEAGAPAFRSRTLNHRGYFFGREIERWAEERGVAVMPGTPTHHSNDINLPNCVLIAGLSQGLNIDRLAHCLLEAHWRDDADLADRDTLATLGQSLGLDAEGLLQKAASEQVHAVYEANTAEAIRRSVFGSPTYFVDGDMFYGQDHLELVARAIERPYAGTWRAGEE